jgi:glutathione S-transferase
VAKSSLYFVREKHLMSLAHQLTILSSVLTSTAAGWRGGAGRAFFKQPAQRPVLFDIENCPYCRMVREAATALHLDLDIRPCPKNGLRFRVHAIEIGGRLQFPLLQDSNTGTVLYESGAIIDYLFRTYADRPAPGMYQKTAMHTACSMLATATRPTAGLRATASHAPKQPLVLWSFEASPYSRPVRELLCELEIPYTLHNLGKEHWTEIGPALQRLKPGPYVPKVGGKREGFMQQFGRVQLPFLQDPNTGAELFESEAIVAYLTSTYAA